jgi:hypothetical protein
VCFCFFLYFFLSSHSTKLTHFVPQPRPAARRNVRPSSLLSLAPLTLSPSSSASSSAPSLVPVEVRYASTQEYDAILRSVGVVRQRLNQLDRIVQAFVPQRGRLDENNEQSWAIDVNRITNGGGGEDSQYGGGGYYNGHEGGTGSETPSADPTPAGGTTLALPAFTNGVEQYDPMAGQNGFALPIVPHQGEYEAVERPLPESDGEVEAAVTLEFLVRSLPSFLPF